MGRGGQPLVSVSHAATNAHLEVYLHGAQITSYRFDEAELLYVSDAAIFDGKTAIRGGIPICFPQFGSQGPLPAHGFARTSLWSLISVSDGCVELELRDSESTRTAWGPYAFSARLVIKFAGPTLNVTFSVRNLGGGGGADSSIITTTGNTTTESLNFDRMSFRVQALLHAYLNVGIGSVTADGKESNVTVQVLGGNRYLDTPPSRRELVAESAPLALIGEFDRVFIAPTENVVIVHGALTGGRNNMIRVTRHATVSRHHNSQHHQPFSTTATNTNTTVPSDVVVWNPGKIRNAAMKDLDADAWTRFVCVEPGIVTPDTILELACGDSMSLNVIYEMTNKQ